jgi:hypothetical protein
MRCSISLGLSALPLEQNIETHYFLEVYGLLCQGENSPRLEL